MAAINKVGYYNGNSWEVYDIAADAAISEDFINKTVLSGETETSKLSTSGLSTSYFTIGKYSNQGNQLIVSSDIGFNNAGGFIHLGQVTGEAGSIERNWRATTLHNDNDYFNIVTRPATGANGTVQIPFGKSGQILTTTDNVQFQKQDVLISNSSTPDTKYFKIKKGWGEYSSFDVLTLSFINGDTERELGNLALFQNNQTVKNWVTPAELTTEINSIETQLSNYLPLTGGTLKTGNTGIIFQWSTAHPVSAKICPFYNEDSQTSRFKYGLIFKGNNANASPADNSSRIDFCADTRQGYNYWHFSPHQQNSPIRLGHPDCHWAAIYADDLYLTNTTIKKVSSTSVNSETGETEYTYDTLSLSDLQNAATELASLKANFNTLLRTLQANNAIDSSTASTLEMTESI